MPETNQHHGSRTPHGKDYTGTMSNPKPTTVPDLLKALSQAKPAEPGTDQPGAKAATKAPIPKVKASTKPAKHTQAHTRTSNRGK